MSGQTRRIASDESAPSQPPVADPSGRATQTSWLTARFESFGRANLEVVAGCCPDRLRRVLLRDGSLEDRDRRDVADRCDELQPLIDRGHADSENTSTATVDGTDGIAGQQYRLGEPLVALRRQQHGDRA
jgi:hypothetical protein